MPTLDRKPRRRLHSARTPDFETELQARAAAAECRALAEPERTEAWRSLRPRLVRWIMETAQTRITAEQAEAISLIYLRRPELLPGLICVMAG